VNLGQIKNTIEMRKRINPKNGKETKGGRRPRSYSRGLLKNSITIRLNKC